MGIDFVRHHCTLGSNHYLQYIAEIAVRVRELRTESDRLPIVRHCGR